MDERFAGLGFYPADICLPKAEYLERWAVVACDQFTAQPEYWERVADTVREAPSTYHLILPEAKLQAPNVSEQITEIQENMERYWAEGILETHPDSLFYMERLQSDGQIRHGLIGMVDLEQYDFTPHSGALIRATEGTVLERIPPRAKVRRGALLELPHVMLLLDDPKGFVIEPLIQETEQMEPLYHTVLMEQGGEVRGWKLSQTQQQKTADALRKLLSPTEQEEKYGKRDGNPLLFAVGDGNHSLATAKACYEEEKQSVPQELWATLPSRYALVELVNNHDTALQFEPIHRVVFGVEPEKLIEAFLAYYPEAYQGQGEGHCIAYTYAGGTGYLTVPHPTVQLAVGTLQNFLDVYCQKHGGVVDYIHGDAVTDTLGAKTGNIGFRLPAMAKEDLFRTVLCDGVLPRKTFSMGHAQDKRYYLEARKIR